MTDRALGRRLQWTAIGLLFIHFDISVGGIPLLPAWIGWLILFFQLPQLAQARPTLGLLRPFALVLGVSAATGRVPWPAAVSLVTGAISLYFYFQLLTDLAALAQERLPADSALPRLFLRCRTVWILGLTATHIMRPYLDRDWPDVLVWARMLIVLAVLLMAFSAIFALFFMAKRLRDKEAG